MYGLLLDANGRVLRHLDSTELSWGREGNDLIFAFSSGLSLGPGEKIQIQIENVLWSDLYYEQRADVVDACGKSGPLSEFDTNGFTPALANPPVKKKCGQKIALVFDL